MKPSAGNSHPPLEGFTLFLERPLGKKIAAAIQRMGVRVVGHWEVLAETADDAEYLGRCAAEGWIPLTADSDVHNVPAQRFLIKRTRLQVFRLTRNHWPWREKLEAFVAALPEKRPPAVDLLAPGANMRQSLWNVTKTSPADASLALPE